MKKDFPENNAIAQAVTPAVLTADSNGASVDLTGYDGGVTFIGQIGVTGDTLSATVFVELEVEESADNSTFSDVADSDLSDYVAGTNDGTFAVVDANSEDDAVFATTYKGSKRYVRPVVNITGTHTNGIPIGISSIKHAYKYPPA